MGNPCRFALSRQLSDDAGATTWCICLRLGLVDCDGTATDFGAMQTGDGLFSLAIDRHFNEAKPLD